MSDKVEDNFQRAPDEQIDRKSTSSKPKQNWFNSTITPSASQIDSLNTKSGNWYNLSNANSFNCKKCQDKPDTLNWNPAQPIKTVSNEATIAKLLEDEDCVDHFCHKDFQFKDYSIYDRAIASEQITRSVITPIDQTTYCQVIKDPSNPDRIFVVQKVVPAFQAEASKDIKGDLDSFVYHKLSQKTANHAQFDHFKLQKKEKKENDTADKFNLVQYEPAHVFDKVYAVIFVFMYKEIEEVCYKLKKEDQDDEVQNSADSENEMNEEQYEEVKTIRPTFVCEKQLFVQDPIFLEDSNEAAKEHLSNENDKLRVDATLRLPQLFFPSQNGQLYFFTKKESEQLVLRQVSLDEIEKQEESEMLASKEALKVNSELNELLNKTLGLIKSNAIVQWPKIIDDYLVVQGLLRDEDGYHQDIHIFGIKNNTALCIENTVLLLNLSVLENQLCIYTADTEQEKQLLVNKHRFKVVKRVYELNKDEWTILQTKENKFQKQEDLKQRFKDSLRRRSSSRSSDGTGSAQNKEQLNLVQNQKIHNRLHKSFLQLRAWGAPKVESKFEDDCLKVQIFVNRSTFYNENTPNFIAFQISETDEALKIGDNLFYTILTYFCGEDEAINNASVIYNHDQFEAIVNFEYQDLGDREKESEQMAFKTTSKLAFQQCEEQDSQDPRCCEIVPLRMKRDCNIVAVLCQDAHGLVHVTFSPLQLVKDVDFQNIKSHQQVSSEMKTSLVYPIFAYTQSTPRSNKVCVANLAANSTQACIDLGNYEFLGFNDFVRAPDDFEDERKYIQRDKHLNKKVRIYTRNEEGQIFGLIFTFFPYKNTLNITPKSFVVYTEKQSRSVNQMVSESTVSKLQILQNIELWVKTKGVQQEIKINRKKKGQNQDEETNQSKMQSFSVFKIKNKQHEKSNDISTFIKVFDRINDKWIEIKFKKKKVLPLPLINGLNEEVYYLTGFEGKTWIQKVYRQDDSTLEVKKQVFKYDGEIVQIIPVVKNVNAFRQRQMAFLALDNNLNLIQLQPDSQNSFTSEVLELNTMFDISLYSFLPDLLIYSPSLGLQTNSMILRQFLDSYRQDQVNENLCFPVLRSKFAHKSRNPNNKQMEQMIENFINKQFKGIKDPSKLKALGKQFMDRFSTSYRQSDVVMIIQNQIVGKYISLINSKEGGSYFLTESNQSQRELDLFDFKDMTFDIDQMKMTDGRIFAKLKQADTIIEFNRLTLLVENSYQDVKEFQTYPGAQNLLWLVKNSERNEQHIEIINFGPCSECFKAENTQKCNIFLPPYKDETTRKIVLQPNGTSTLFDVQKKVEIDENLKSNFDIRIVRKQNTDLPDLISRMSSVLSQKVTDQEFIQKLHYEYDIVVYCRDQNAADDLNLNSNAFEIILSEEFLVLAGNLQILFKKFQVSDSDIAQEATQIIDLKKYEFCKDKVSVINLHSSLRKFLPKLFDFNKRTNIDVATEQSLDVIQIASRDCLMSWNLDFNHQVSVFQNYKDLLEPERYANTGFLLCEIEKNENQDLWSAQFFTTNHQYSAFCVPFSNTKSGAYFKPYSMLDLRQIRHLQFIVGTGQLFFNFPCSLQVFVADVYGRTVFETHVNFKYLGILEKMIARIDKEEDLSPAYIEQLGRTIIQPLSIRAQQTFQNDDWIQANIKGKLFDQEQKERINFVEILHNLLLTRKETLFREKLSRALDICYSVLKRNYNMQVSNIICNVEHFKLLFTDLQEMQNAYEYLEKWKHEKAIKFGGPIEINWIVGDKNMYLQSETNLLTEQQIRQKIRQHQTEQISDQSSQEFKIHKVTVHAYQIDWYLGKEQEFFIDMSESQNLEFFGDHFLISMMEMQNFNKISFKQEILWKVYIPYLFYLACALYYFQFEWIGQNPILINVLRGAILIGDLFFTSIEIKQMIRAESIVAYFYDFWNFSMFTLCILNYIIIVTDYFNIYGINTVLLPSLSSYLMVFQVFYFNQIFETHSMYFSIIVGTLYDTRYFVFQVLIAVFGFSVALLIIQKKTEMIYREKIEPIYNPELEGVAQPITDRFGSLHFFNSFFQQYIGMLGEFELLEAGVDTYPQSIQNLTWLFFLLSTILTQLVFLNVLVGVICNSYDERWSKKELYGRRQLYRMFADFSNFISFSSSGLNKPFFYVIEPCNEQEDESEFEQVKKEIEVLQEQVEAQQDQGKAICATLQHIETKIGRIDERYEQTQSQIEKIEQYMACLVQEREARKEKKQLKKEGKKKDKQNEDQQINTKQEEAASDETIQSKNSKKNKKNKSQE